MDPILASYLETALWSSTDESDQRGGEPMDANYSLIDIAPESVEKAKEDLEEFLTEARKLEGFDTVEAQDETEGSHYHIGHDFWLTRNGHGAGFWDGDYPKGLGEALTKLSKKFGEIYAYVGDNGVIYFS